MPSVYKSKKSHTATPPTVPVKRPRGRPPLASKILQAQQKDITTYFTTASGAALITSTKTKSKKNMPLGADSIHVNSPKKYKKKNKISGAVTPALPQKHGGKKSHAPSAMPGPGRGRPPRLDPPILKNKKNNKTPNPLAPLPRTFSVPPVFRSVADSGRLMSVAPTATHPSLSAAISAAGVRPAADHQSVAFAASVKIGSNGQGSGSSTKDRDSIFSRQQSATQKLLLHLLSEGPQPLVSILKNMPDMNKEVVVSVLDVLQVLGFVVQYRRRGSLGHSSSSSSSSSKGLGPPTVVYAMSRLACVPYDVAHACIASPSISSLSTPRAESSSASSLPQKLSRPNLVHLTRIAGDTEERRAAAALTEQRIAALKELTKASDMTASERAGALRELMLRFSSSTSPISHSSSQAAFMQSDLLYCFLSSALEDLVPVASTATESELQLSSRGETTHPGLSGAAAQDQSLMMAEDDEMGSGTGSADHDHLVDAV